MKSWKSGGDSQIAGYYDLQEKIGSGHFAVVKRAKHVFTGEEVAVKVVDKTKLDEVSRLHIYHEVRCMKLVQHPYVVRLYEVIDTKTKLYLIQEYGDGGDLFDYIVKRDNGLEEELAKKYFRQILSAVAFCHRLHVVHRDLKPENVIFFPKLDVVKVTDFGFSNSFIPGDKLKTACGSLAYSAPEVLLGDAYDAVSSDIWSLGVILYMLVVGRLPFSEANDSETLTKIMDCQYKVPSCLSLACQRLIKNLLVKEPHDRLAVSKILSDEWFGKDVIDNVANDAQPLTCRRELSESTREHIIDIMVSGNVATREDILMSLENKVYNHIEATFYLLAERHLATMLVQQHINRSIVQSRNFTASSSTSSLFSGGGRGGSGDNLMQHGTETIPKKGSKEAMSAITETEVLQEDKEDEQLSQLEKSQRFSVLIEEPLDDPDELPQFYEIREGVDDLELECRKSSLTRLANIAEMSESDDAGSSGHRSARRSICGRSDSGPEQDATIPLEVGSPSIRPRSARSSWISSSRRSSANQLRSGSISGQQPYLARIVAPTSPYGRLARSASSSDASDIESDNLSVSMNRSLARMKRGAFNRPHSGCFRCDLEFHRSLAASLLLSDKNHKHRGHKHKGGGSKRRSGIETSEATTTSASDTEQPLSVAASRCPSAAASVSFILGAVANEIDQLSQPEQGGRRSSLPHSDITAIRPCRRRSANHKGRPLLQKVPFDQQKLPSGYRQALLLRLGRNHRSSMGRNRFSTVSDAPLLPGFAYKSADKTRPRTSTVPPKIDENSTTDRSSQDIPNVVSLPTNVITSENGCSIPDAKNRIPPAPEPTPNVKHCDDRMQVNAANLFGHVSAPPTEILSGNSGVSNRKHHQHHHHHHHRHHHPQCDLRPLHQIQLLKSQRTSEFSVSSVSRGTGSEYSLPASSAPSIRNGFKTPSVSSVRSDPDIGIYNYANFHVHSNSTVMGGSCRNARFRQIDRKRNEDCQALLGESSPPTNDPNFLTSNVRRNRGDSWSSYRSSNNNNPTARTSSFQSSHTSGVPASARHSADSTTVRNRRHHHKRNLLRSLFGQCFGCSLGQNHSSNVPAGQKKANKNSLKSS